jgi:hypothetical protein
MTLPKCAVLACPNTADPRWFARDMSGRAVMICDGHETPLLPGEVEPEFRLPTLEGEPQRQLSLAFSEVLAVFRRAAEKAPSSLASDYTTEDMSPGEVHRYVVTRLQEVHFFMQLAIMRGYRVI